MALNKTDLTAIKEIVDESIESKVKPMIDESVTTGVSTLKKFVQQGFDGMNDLIGNVETRLVQGFDGMHELITNVETNLTDEIQIVGGVVTASVTRLDDHGKRIETIEKKLKIKK